jgi:putative membrane protein
MKIMNILNAGVCAALLSFSVSSLAGDISAEDFIEKASAANIAEIETGKVALDKAESMDVKSYARKMIGEHSTANGDLRTLAAQKDVEMEDDASLMSKAKKFILEQRDGESFDEAYINNQIKAHQSAIELYKKGVKSTDAGVRAFSVAILPKIEQHLATAKALSRLSKSQTSSVHYSSYSTSSIMSKSH